MIAFDNITSDLALDEALAEWKKHVLAELNGATIEKKLVTRVAEDITLQPLYTRADFSDRSHLDSLPGEAPFRRGPLRSSGGRFWQAAQEITASQSLEYNRALLAGLQRGQDAIALLPDQASKGAVSSREPGGASAGIHLHDVLQFSKALDAVDLRAVAVHLPTGADPRALAAIYLAFAKSRGVDLADLTGSVTADPLATAAETGRFPGDLGAQLSALSDWTRWAAENAPSLQTIGVDAALWGNGGATPTQELGIALGCAAEYIRASLTNGLSLDVIARRIRFRFSIGSLFFTEIAKFRAFRPLWTRLLVAFGGSAELGAAGALCAATGRWNKTLLDQHVNMLRTTTEALSAVFGGCDCLHIAPFDEVTGQTTEFSRRIALNTHTLLAEEFGAAAPADPAGGSWYVEKLTDEIARAAWTHFQELERQGGFAACLKSGYVQKITGQSLAAKSSAVASRRTALVGTNLFPNLREKPAVLHPAPVKKWADLPSTSPPFPEGASSPGEIAAEWSFPAAIEAAGRGLNAHDLALRFGGATLTSSPIPAVKTARAAEEFEALRRASDAFATRTGSRPKVFLAKMGSPKQHKARADFSTAFFSVGGFEIIGPSGLADAPAAAAAALKSGAQIAVLCSTDETYPALAPAFAEALKAASARPFVVLAGLPADPAQVAAFRAAGFDDFIHARANAQEMLASFLEKIGAAT